MRTLDDLHFNPSIKKRQGYRRIFDPVAASRAFVTITIGIDTYGVFIARTMEENPSIPTHFMSHGVMRIVSRTKMLSTISNMIPALTIQNELMDLCDLVA
jgi:hypothetical protein